MPTDFTLSSGEIVQLRDVNPSKKYATGSTHLTTNWGNISVVGLVDTPSSRGKYNKVVIQLYCGQTFITRKDNISNSPLLPYSCFNKKCDTCIQNCTTDSRRVNKIPPKKNTYTANTSFYIYLHDGSSVEVYSFYTARKFKKGTIHKLSCGIVVQFMYKVVRGEGNLQGTKFVVAIENDELFLVDLYTKNNHFNTLSNSYAPSNSSMKTCTKCLTSKSKDTTNFEPRKDSQDGFRGVCRVCRAETIKRKQVRSNKLRRLFRKKNTIQAIKEREYTTLYRIKRSKDPLYIIHRRLSTGFHNKLRSLTTSKPSSTMEYVGCTKQELLDHLNSGEYTMEDYMKNTKGNILFHIDHIIPSKYYMDQIELDEENNIINTDILYKWWNYRNLRVHPAVDNMSKSDTLDEELIKEYGIADLL